MADAGGFDYWRGDEQASLPALGSDAGGFDYWRGGELLTMYSDTAGIAAVEINISKSANYIQVVTP